MKYLHWKNKNNRIFNKNVEYQKLIFKKAYECLDLNKKKRLHVGYKLRNLNKKSSKTVLNNRCTLTNRSHAVYKKFKLSRLMFRDLALEGLLTGVKKSSW